MLKFGRFWTAANVLSLCRPLLALPAAILIWTEGALGWILSLILMAALTDWLDGQWARRTGATSEWGKILDPVCDKMTVFIIGTAMVLKNLVPLWFLGVVVLRDLLIIAGSTVLAKRLHEVQMSNWAGKAAVTSITITFFLALLGPDQPVLQFCIWSSVVLTMLSLYIYGWRFFRLKQHVTADYAHDETL